MTNQTSVKELNDSNFHDEVIKSNTPVLVDFWAPWCGPCKMMTPVLDEISNEFSDKLKVVKVNIDDNPLIAEKMSIQAIPTLAVFRNGKILTRLTGARHKNDLVSLLKNEEII